jgi:hypothetical protein
MTSWINYSPHTTDAGGPLGLSVNISLE